MTTDNRAPGQSRLPANPIFRLAKALAIATTAGIYALPAITVAIWLTPGWLGVDIVGLNVGGFDLVEASLPARLAALAVALLGVAIQVYGLVGLRQTFSESATGHWFSTRSIQGFRRFAWMSLAMVFVGIAQHSAWSVILSMGTPGVQNHLSVTLGSPELTGLFTALLFVFVAHIFVAGKAVDEENAAFI